MGGYRINNRTNSELRTSLLQIYKRITKTTAKRTLPYLARNSLPKQLRNMRSWPALLAAHTHTHTVRHHQPTALVATDSSLCTSECSDTHEGMYPARMKTRRVLAIRTRVLYCCRQAVQPPT